MCTFESDGRRFEQVGYNLVVLKPGQRGRNIIASLTTKKTS